MRNLSVASGVLFLSFSVNTGGTITRDTSAGLDWLDVTETRGFTHNGFHKSAKFLRLV